MDPNENLKQQLEHAQNLLRGAHVLAYLSADSRRVVCELSELVIALDEWLRNGGFKPDAWTHRKGQ